MKKHITKTTTEHTYNHNEQLVKTVVTTENYEVETIDVAGSAPVTREYQATNGVLPLKGNENSFTQNIKAKLTSNKPM